ncbi:hypothetical protein QR680_008380 [Steinernema hermaphroditum]|uniref:O-phosphoseryl-tRNA(Sec) selenium transferase n=1 Tax=Steinernema hermaphroditum TaxID=289476 RepID=A0AA39M6X6_9BILA|nr:hypothetical protein QR680_008380 [Steinernema hermaphroditum]
MFDDLIQKKELPEEGWSEQLIEQFVVYLANMDTNNRIDLTPIGAGEREGRVVAPLVARLHMNMSHGIGRSGNLTECQPKAQGSSMMAQIANEFALQTIKLMGVRSCKGALIVPMATGMALSLCLSSWRRSRPEAKYVIFSRIDQKSCFKSILFAGYEPLIVDLIRDDHTDSLQTNIDGIRRVIRDRPEQILAVMTTTSCFAPRAPDDLVEVAKLCSEFGLFHLVNNAYGLQSPKCVEFLEEARQEGRIDAFVQSTDKNFLIPVGGAVIGTFKKSKAEAIAQFYPGRASAIPSRDFAITCLYLGKSGWHALLQQREKLFEVMKTKLRSFAETINEKVLDIPENLISLAMSLKTIPSEKQTLFGSILFSRGITGARVVPSTAAKKSIEGYEFVNFGSHTSEQHDGYLNIACGIGMTAAEVDELFTRLQDNYKRFLRKEALGNENQVANDAGTENRPLVDAVLSCCCYRCRDSVAANATSSRASEKRARPSSFHSLIRELSWSRWFLWAKRRPFRPTCPKLWVCYDCRDGIVPFPTTSATAMIWRRNLLIFGGSARFPQEVTRVVNDIFLLNLDTGIWSRPRDNIGEKKPPPRDKATGWEFDDKCYFFGGYGDSPDFILDTFQHLEKFFAYPSDFVYCGNDPRLAWNRQLLMFDSEWHILTQGGNVPLARAAASSTLVPHESTVYLFGGRLQSDRLNDLYALDLISLIWRQIIIDGPCGRSWCTLTYVPKQGEEQDYCFLYGGIDTESNPLSDCWRLKIGDRENIRWEEEAKYTAPCPRLWHSACYIGGQIIVFGGMASNPFDRSDQNSARYLNDIWRYDVSPKSLKALCCMNISYHFLDLLSHWNITSISDKAIWSVVLREIKAYFRSQKDLNGRKLCWTHLPLQLRSLAEYVFRQKSRYANRKIRRLLELCSSPR